MSRSDLLIIAAMMPLVVYHSMKVGEAMALNQSFLWPELAVTVVADADRLADREERRMNWTVDPNAQRLCLARLESPDHDHRCGAPYGHGGPEHCCQVCGGWYRRDGGEATA
jgi:hypothetical protein